MAFLDLSRRSCSGVLRYDLLLVRQSINKVETMQSSFIFATSQSLEIWNISNFTQTSSPSIYIFSTTWDWNRGNDKNIHFHSSHVEAKHWNGGHFACRYFETRRDMWKTRTTCSSWDVYCTGAAYLQELAFSVTYVLAWRSTFHISCL